MNVLAHTEYNNRISRRRRHRRRRPPAGKQQADHPFAAAASSLARSLGEQHIIGGVRSHHVHSELMKFANCSEKLNVYAECRAGAVKLQLTRCQGNCSNGD
jgi:predicted alpha/beta-hydrolase family hydrolase